MPIEWQQRKAEIRQAALIIQSVALMVLLSSYDIYGRPESMGLSRIETGKFNVPPKQLKHKIILMEIQRVHPYSFQFFVKITSSVCFLDSNHFKFLYIYK